MACQKKGKPMEATLTIGMAHHNDFHGAYFTIQDIRKELIFNRRHDLLQKIQFLIIENDKESQHAQQLNSLNYQIGNVKILQFDDVVGTSATRNKIIEEATTDFVLVMDCHVLLCPVVDILDRLFTFMSYNPNTNDLYTGPLVYDNMGLFATHYNDSWGSQMWGQWGATWDCTCEAFKFSIINNDNRCKFVSMVEQKEITKCEYCNKEFPDLKFPGHERNLIKEGYNLYGKSPQDKPFEVFAQGLGLFFTRKNSWLKFNEHAKGFGGEECYIHEKYRQAGRKTICLPFLKWLHRFGRPDGVSYPLTAENKVRNYILEFTELGLDMAPLKKHFVEDCTFPQETWQTFLDEANSIYNKQPNINEDLQSKIKALEEELHRLTNS